MLDRKCDKNITCEEAIDIQREAWTLEKEALDSLALALAGEIVDFLDRKNYDTAPRYEEVLRFNQSIFRILDSLCMMNWLLLRKKDDLFEMQVLLNTDDKHSHALEQLTLSLMNLVEWELSFICTGSTIESVLEEQVVSVLARLAGYVSHICCLRRSPNNSELNSNRGREKSIMRIENLRKMIFSYPFSNVLYRSVAKEELHRIEYYYRSYSVSFVNFRNKKLPKPYLNRKLFS